MPARRKINLERVKASLATPCPHCGYQIPPSEIQRPTFNQVTCPKCKMTSTSDGTPRKTFSQE